MQPPAAQVHQRFCTPVELCPSSSAIAVVANEGMPRTIGILSYVEAAQEGRLRRSCGLSAGLIEQAERNQS